MPPFAPVLARNYSLAPEASGELAVRDSIVTVHRWQMALRKQLLAIEADIKGLTQAQEQHNADITAALSAKHRDVAVTNALAKEQLALAQATRLRLYEKGAVIAAQLALRQQKGDIPYCGAFERHAEVDAALRRLGAVSGERGIALAAMAASIRDELTRFWEMAPDRSATCDYKLILHTSHLPNAASDAGLWAVLYGANGDTGRHQLRHHLEPEDFYAHPKQGNVDVFHFTGADVGAIVALQISHDDHGINTDWHLDYAEAFNVTVAPDLCARFNHGAWLSKSHGLAALLYAPVEDSGAGAAVYTVTIATSDAQNASFHGTVWMDLTGDGGLLSRRDVGHAFKAGSRETVTLQGPDIGDVRSVALYHDADGTWGVQHVEVRCSARPERNYFFHYQDFLRPKPIRGCRAEIPVATPYTQTPTTYTIVLRTSAHVVGADTDGDVALTLHGEAGAAGVATLSNEGAKKLRAGGSDTLVLECAYVGPISRVEVVFSPVRETRAWHLDCIEVTARVDQLTRTFPLHDWFEENTLRRTLELPAP